MLFAAISIYSASIRLFIQHQNHGCRLNGVFHGSSPIRMVQQTTSIIANSRTSFTNGIGNGIFICTIEFCWLSLFGNDSFLFRVGWETCYEGWLCRKTTGKHSGRNCISPLNNTVKWSRDSHLYASGGSPQRYGLIKLYYKYTTLLLVGFSFICIDYETNFFALLSRLKW